MKHQILVASCLDLFLIFVGGCTSGPAEGEIEIIRDQWGIAHVYAENEAALFYGAGYVTAEDRMLQMALKRRVVQGRIAEILGGGPENRFLESDRRFRILGFHHKAKELLETIAQDTRRNLEGYAAGVNTYLDEWRTPIPHLFQQYGGKPEPWTATDCIAIWLRMGDRFSLGWQGEVDAKRELERLLAKGDTGFQPKHPVDDSAEIVSEKEFQRSNPEVYEKLKDVLRKRTASLVNRPTAEIRLSHNWLVAGPRSATGKPILESDPHYSVNTPAFWYEIHLHGGRYNVRGMGVPGTPGLFIGWNQNIAWGATGFGGDTADLFQEKTDPEHPNQYLWKDTWQDFRIRTETIQVKNQDPVNFEVKLSRHGPVVSALYDNVKPGEVFALQYTMLKGTTSSLEAVLRMMRATDWSSFRQALSTYIAPPLNMIYADVEDNIGYQATTNVPIRYEDEPLPKEGWTGEDEWEMVPFEDLPNFLNPESDAIFTANHLPAGSWYPYRVSSSRGEGPRAFRLRELFTQDPDRKFSVEDFIELVHQDCVNPVLRDFVILSRKVVEEDGAPTPEVSKALEAIKDWDYRVSTESLPFPVVSAILAKLEEIKFQGTGLEKRFGDGWGGVSRFVKEMMPVLRETGKTPGDPVIRDWMKRILHEGYLARGTGSQVTETTGWLKEQSARSSDATRSSETASTSVHIRHMPYQDVPEGYGAERYGSLARDYDLDSPPLCCPLTQSIWAQDGNSYSQIVDLADLDRSLSMLPPGLSEDPNSPHFKDQMIYWKEGTYHAAPLSRAGVEKIKESSRRLIYR